MKPTLIRVSVLIVILFSIASVVDTSLRADSINPGVYSVNQNPFGKTYGEWTSDFWVWMISIPQDDNPNLDPTGEKCGINQTDPLVHFLVPTFGGDADRTCEIPSGKAILFPLLVTECNYIENPELKTETELRDCAREGNDLGPRSMAVTVDGIELEGLESYRTESPLFNLTFPANNIFSVPPGTTEAVSDGFWVFLEPLSNGSHDIEFRASLLDPSGVGNYNTHVKYQLLVGTPDSANLQN